MLQTRESSDANLASLWHRVLLKLQSLTTPQDYEAFRMEIKPISFSNGVLLLQARDNIAYEWAQHQVSRLMSAAQAAIAPDTTVKLEAQNLSDMPISSETFFAEEGIRLNPLYTYDNFVVGPCNRLSHAAALAVSESPGRAYNPLFLHGAVGLGKTHLLQAICHSIMQRQPNIRIVYISCETFINHFISTIKTGAWESFRTAYRSTDVLLIDDVQFLANSERTQEEFFHMFNALYNAQKQIVLSSDSPPRDIPSLEERLVSRFKWGLVARLDPPEFETRVAIVEKKAALRGIPLSNDAARYIAEKTDTNIRELEGAILRVAAFAALSNSDPDLSLARAAIDDGAPPAKTINIDDILRETVDYFGLKIADLQSKKKSKSISRPRQICMYLARSLTGHSFEEIGGYFGGRDHSTVMYAYEKIRERMKSDAELRATVTKLDTNIKHN